MVIEELINKYYDELNDSDIHIWKYIYKNKRECCMLPIESLAEKCNVSRTTILRFAKKIGLKGYAELKYCLKNDLDKIEKSTTGNVINIDDICNNYIRVVNDLRDKDFNNICKIINKAHNIFLLGTGTIQKGAARELQRLFYGVNRYIHIIEGAAETNILLRGITSDDLVIIISLSGESDEIYNLCRELKIRNIPILSITQLESNRLANNSTESLYMLTKKVNYGIDKKYMSITLIYIIIEILYIRFVNYLEENEIDE